MTNDVCRTHLERTNDSGQPLDHRSDVGNQLSAGQAVSWKIDGKGIKAVMGQKAGLQLPHAAIAASAVHEQHRRALTGGRDSTRRDLDDISIYFDLHRSALLRRPKGTVEVVDDVGRIFESNREPHQIFADARGLKVFVAELLVGRRRRVDDQRLCVTNVR